MVQFILCVFCFLIGTVGARAESIELQTLVDTGKIECQLSGDGTTTNQARLTVVNRTSQALTVSIPAGQFFLPEDETKNQVMMTTEKRQVEVPPGKTTEEPELPTACVSPKSMPPPGPSSVYTPGSYPDPDLAAAFQEAFRMARESEKNGQFDEVPIPQERRVQAISQLAIWMMLADVTKKPQDQITTETIAADILRSSGTSRESLPPAEMKELDEGVSKIFAAADLTRKQAQPEGVLVQQDPETVPCNWQFESAVVFPGGTSAKKKNLKKLLDAFIMAAGEAADELAALNEAYKAVGIGDVIESVSLIYVCKDAAGKVVKRKVVPLTKDSDTINWARKLTKDPKAKTNKDTIINRELKNLNKPPKKT